MPKKVKQGPRSAPETPHLSSGDIMGGLIMHSLVNLSIDLIVIRKAMEASGAISPELARQVEESNQVKSLRLLLGATIKPEILQALASEPGTSQ